MHLKTILNRVAPQKSFVYRRIKWLDLGKRLARGDPLAQGQWTNEERRSTVHRLSSFDRCFNLDGRHHLQKRRWAWAQ